MTPWPIPPRDDGLHPLAYVAMVLVLALLAAMAFAREAPAHQAPSGWSYDPWCCGGHDCAMVDARAVTAGPDGYTVRIAPGSHPMVPAGAAGEVHVVPHDKGRRSPDGEHHICLYPPGVMRCFYAPPQGS